MNGDYIFTGLPSGPYTIAFSLSGFETQTRNVVLAPTQVLPLEVTLGVAAVSEEVTVVGSSADTLTRTAQIATNFSQDLIAMLPTSRDLNSILMMAPGVHPTGPAGAFSFGGSVSYENLFLLNGVSINENIRGQAFDTAIEDAIQETTVANGGVSAEFGRFSGGVVNIITKSGGNRFSGSFRNSINNDMWRTLTPFETERLATTPEPRIDNVVPTYEYTFGGPIMRDRLWFFTSGRLRDESQGRTLIGTAVPYEFREEQRRYEVKGTYSMNQTHRFQVNYNHHDRAQINHSFNQNVDDGPPEPRDAHVARAAVCRHLHRHADGQARRRSARLEADVPVHRLGGQVDRSHRGHAAHRQQPRRRRALVVGHVLRRLHAGRDATTPTSSSRARTSCRRRDSGSHNFVFGYDTFDDIRTANNHQSGSDYRILSAGAILTGAGRRRERHLPDLPRRRDHDDSVEPDSRGERRVELPDAFPVPQRHVACDRSA